MTEAEIKISASSKKSTSTPELAGVTLVMIGRVLALVTALFLIRAGWETGPTLFGALQPFAIASLLLVGVVSRRSTGTLLAIGYVVVFMCFLYLRTAADETAIPIHYGYPILMDRILFLGTLPSVWLQHAFYVPGRISVVDVVLSATYITYFIAPHLIAVVVWKTRPELFPQAIVAISLTFMLGLFFYFAIPTAPPWLASDRGDIDANVVRVLPELSAQVAGDTYDETARAVGQNDVAAMPSLHTGLTTMVALLLASYGRRWRWLGIAYVTLMATALVYLGEHYVIDEIAGIALAFGIWRLVFESRAFAWLSPRLEAEPAIVEIDTSRRRAA